MCPSGSGKAVVADRGTQMKLIDLPVDDQALVLAFTEIAKQECGDRTWAELEPVLAACWERTHGEASKLTWADVAPYVRTGCGMDE